MVGLPGTGDQTTEVPYTQQTILNMLRNMGVALPNVTTMQPNDVASVMVTGEVPAFAHSGQRVDVTVSAMGNATSLAGGVLLPTPLRGGNGMVYAQAQGPLLVSGFASGANGTTTSVNVPTVGSLPSGGILANTIPTNYAVNGTTELLLNTPSFQTAQQIADVINASFGGTATAVSPGEVDLTAGGIRADALHGPGFVPAHHAAGTGADDYRRCAKRDDRDECGRHARARRGQPWRSDGEYPDDQQRQPARAAQPTARPSACRTRRSTPGSPRRM